MGRCACGLVLLALCSAALGAPSQDDSCGSGTPCNRFKLAPASLLVLAWAVSAGNSDGVRVAPRSAGPASDNDNSPDLVGSRGIGSTQQEQRT
jgi:hypothetical protein